MKASTKAIRVGQCPDSSFGAVINPIWQSATFVWDNLDTIPEHDYTRVSNPNRSTLEEIIASLEGADYAVCFSSGMAAIVAAFSLLQHGDHLLVASDIYGGTFRVAEKILPKQGISVSTFDANDPDSILKVLRPETKMLIFESPTNPNLRIADLGAIVRVAKAHNILTVFDNTFASPILLQPLEYGVDIVVHSTTKYISGHSDVIGGALATKELWIHEAIFEYAKSVGAVPSPFDCWLSIRGVKTLGARMKVHCQNALAIAEFLDKDARVKNVYYPGLPSHPDHHLATRQFKNGFGGMIAFEVVGTEQQAKRFAESTKLFLLAESLGGVESLVGYPRAMSHATMSDEQQLERGITPQSIRLSVGIEDVTDLIEDLSQALAKAFSESGAVETRALVEA